MKKVKEIKVLDENGNFTGEIMDKDKVHEKNLFHEEIGVFILKNNKQVLLQKRSANKKFNPNKWWICAGHVDADETVKQAAIRECYEEIGVSINENELLPFDKIEINKKVSNSNITYYFYSFVDLDEKDFVIQESELSEVKWFDIDEVINLINNHDDGFNWKDINISLFEKLKQVWENDKNYFIKKLK